MELKSRKSPCTICMTFWSVVSTRDRPTSSTASTRASSRHCRSTAWPTMPVAPKMITRIGGRAPLLHRSDGVLCSSDTRPQHSSDTRPRPYPQRSRATWDDRSAPGLASSALMFRLAFHTPRIPGNTGNAIRTAAATGCALHLIEPLGFDLSDTKLRRAGLDYHDLASVTVHPNLQAAFDNWSGARIFAFTTRAERLYTEVAYESGDVLLFGAEPTG